MISNPCPRLLSAALGIFLITAPAASRAQVDDWTLANSIVKSIRTPMDIPLMSFEKKDFPITDFGAVPDGKTDARPAIQTAIEKASSAGGARVLIPKGVWFCKGPINLRSKVNLTISKGATLLFSPDPADYLPTVLTRREGIELYGYSPLIYGYKVQDVAITGFGIIDGNAQSGFHQWAEKQELDREKLLRQDDAAAPVKNRVYGEGTYLRPSMIQFIESERILLEDVTLTNAPFRGIHLASTDHSTVRKIHVDSRRPGNEGINLESVTYVLVENSSFRTAESPLSIKSTRDRDERQTRRPSAYIVVRNNDMGGEKGILMASQMAGGIRNVFFDNNTVRPGQYAMMFEADMERGGAVEHVRVRNMTVESAKEHLIRFQLNFEHKEPFKGHLPAYRDFVFENIKAGHVGMVLEAHAPDQVPLQNVLLRNISIKRAYQSFILENVEVFQLENVQIGNQMVNGLLDWKEAPPPQ
ncbi:MAG TPA: glycosyl hydrolase family 28-related protein [Gammaproteobacteria bacterium]|nr:glycosyl hydrolase family 28-related protein [Gammaproteobacteria bacterium]